MSFNAALSSGQLETLRGKSTLAPHYAGSVYVSVCPSTTIYSARVNQATFTASFAQVTYDGGSGTLADVVDGMTVLISHTNDRTAAFFTGRVRKAPGAATLYINETSANIQDNDYIFVVEDFAIRDKLGRMVSGVLKHDYEIGFRQLPPVIYNLKSAYVDWVTGASYQIAFAPLAVAATSGATISTWAWDVGDGTITVGSTSTQNITATFPAGFRHVYLTVTDSGNRTATRKIPVWAHSAAYPPQLLTAGNLQVSANVASGVDATITGYANVDAILDNTLLVAWAAEEVYQDASGPITGDNIVFVGRIRKHTDTTRTDELFALDSERQYTIEGALTQLARIEQLPYEMLNKATPTLFGQITNMTLWRGIVYLLAECSTFLDLHSLKFIETTNTFLAPTRNPVGNILNAVNDLAGSVNSAMQMNYNGSAEITYDARMLSTANRAALVTVANWTASDIIDIQHDHSHVRTVGRLKSTGGAYNSVSNLYATFESIAPGVAQDYPEGTGSLDRQVLTANVAGGVAQSELNTRAGNAFERAQETDTLTVTFMDGYHSVLIPSLDQWHTFTISDNAINITLDSTIRWLLTEVTTSHNSAEGTKEVRAVFVRETQGSPGQTVTYPAIAEVPLLDPTFPPFDPYPTYPIDPIDLIGEDPVVIIVDTGNEIPSNGNAVVVWTATQCLVVVNPKLTTTPGTRDVTPVDLLGTIRDGRLGAGKDFYLLSSDGITSKVYYTEDIFAGSVIWTETEIDSEYSQLKTTATQGEVYILSITSPDNTVLITFDGLNWTDYTVTLGTESSDRLNLVTHTFPLGEGTGCDLTIDFGSTCNVSRIAVDILFINQRPDLYADVIFYFYDGAGGSGSLIATHGLSSGGLADGVLHNLGADVTVLGAVSVVLQANWLNNFGTPNSGWIDNVQIDAVVSTNAIATRYSTDFAGTFAAAVSVGDTPGAFAGFDTSKIGTAVLAGANGQTMKAASGGAYASYGSAHAQGAYFVPRYIFSSTSSGNTGTSPEYLLFAPALDTGASMWRTTAGGNTFFDVTPIRSAAEGLAVGYRCAVMHWRSGSIIFAIAEFGGSTRRLCVSDDAGATWAFSGALDADAIALTTRKSDIDMKEVYLTNGPNLGICFNAFAATPLISDRNLGLTDDLTGVEVYG